MLLRKLPTTTLMCASNGSDSGFRSIDLQRYEHERSVGERNDAVAAEEPLQIRVEGRNFAVLMRTPGHDRELVAGFLISEGVIRSRQDLFDLVECPGSDAAGNVVDVWLKDPSSFRPELLARSGITSSSCGICGRQSIGEALQMHQQVSPGPPVAAATLFGLSGKLAGAQSGFKATGGLHACGLFRSNGELLAAREDVGRHNALDKLIGWACLGDGLPLSATALLLSGRVSFEMMQKSLAAGIPFVAAISAPTSLAVEFARCSGQTLIGFLRNGSCNVYAGPERLIE
jgi:FdhD protein